MTNLETVDCIIVGAGPAGLSAAEEIGASGLNVIVLEEHPTIGLPVACGEGMSIEKINEFSIPTEVVSSRNADAIIERKINLQRFFFGTGGTATSNLETAVINRPRFDQFLAKRAQKAGAEIRTETAAIQLEIFKTHAIIRTRNSKGEKNSIVTKVVVGCDGPASHIRKWTGLNKKMEVVQGVEYRVKGVLTDALDFYFDHEAFPEGYGWVFPKKETTNIGIVCAAKQNPRKKLDSFIKKIGQKAAIEKISVEKTIAGIIPSTGPLPQTYADRVLLAGDAGGFPNMIFYGGIIIAMHTGKLAGEIIINANERDNFGKEFLQNYESCWKEMPYADESIARAHEIFYHKFTNKELNALGVIVDGQDITKMHRRDSLIFIYRTLRHPRFIRLWKQLFGLVDGFAIARDYGF